MSKAPYFWLHRPVLRHNKTHLMQVCTIAKPTCPELLGKVVRSLSQRTHSIRSTHNHGQTHNPRRHVSVNKQSIHTPCCSSFHVYMYGYRTWKSEPAASIHGNHWNSQCQILDAFWSQLCVLVRDDRRMHQFRDQGRHDYTFCLQSSGGRRALSCSQTHARKDIFSPPILE